ncbi:MAG: S8 family serine peptidase [Candidatus Bathyarchaeota archaeon]|jgi:subtilisin family serine protease|nr:S8 family serine peptidase [Candidatus Bathyarchaeota archaeon A05DMB-3]MDH7607405.1 S8 family serine peptidase [Candidatus Bathyarchaeota archaeon]
MKKKFSKSFIVILMIALLSIASYNLLFNGTYREQKTQDSDSYADVTLLDADNDKIVDSLKKEIESDPYQTVDVIIQYNAGHSVYKTLSRSSNAQFISRLSDTFSAVTVKHAYTLVSAVAVTAPAEVIPKLAEFSGVVRIEPDFQVQVALDTAVQVINVDRVWADYGLYGENQTIAVLDTGIWPEHPDFEGKIVGWADFVNSNPDPYDDNGHGTMVASIAAGTGAGSNGTYKGVAYMAKIVAIKVLDEKGRGYVSNIIRGLEWVAANKNVYNITVTNLSLGSIGPSDGKDVLSLACDQVVDEGIVVVVAAGNFGPKPYTVGTPAAAEKVIAVGAVDRAKNIASFSSRGPTLDDRFKPDICAVGVSIMAGSLPYFKYPEKEWIIYRVVSGTSAAAPMIAGAAALIRQAHPDWSPEKIKAALITRAVQREGGVNNDYGYGVADVFEALKGPKPTIALYTWKFVAGVPTFAEARAYGQRSPNPFVLIKGTWFTPDSYLSIKWDNTTELASDVYVNENGTFAVNVTLPRSNWGTHYISVWDTSGFITQNSYEIVKPTLVFSSSELFQTTIDFGRPGVTLWAKGEYYDPNGFIAIKWDNTTVLAENVPTDAEGMFKTQITVPLDATTGIHHVNVWNGTEFAAQSLLHVLVATPVSGIIYENTTWTKYGSPYVLTGDLLIYENKTLTIEPGVEVLANGEYYIWLYKGATLNATGEETNPIIFTANRSATPNWGGLCLHYTSTNTTIILDNVHISYAHYVLTWPESWQVIDFTGLKFIIKNCNITRCISITEMNGMWTSDFYVEITNSFIAYFENGGIKINYLNGIVKINNNTFTSGNGDAIALISNGRYYEICRNTIISNYGSGIYIDGTVCYGVIKDNLIMYNAEAGLKLRPLDYEHLVAMNNYIARNGIGVKFTEFAQQLRCDIVHNDIQSNAGYAVVSAPGGDGVIINATYNYWGTASQNEIENRIYHFFDNFELREIYYKPFLNASTRAQLFGYLVDFSTGNPIENATISAIGMTFIQTSSNATGYFSLEGLLPGEYSISITKEGYESISWFESVGAAQAFESSISMRSVSSAGGPIKLTFSVPWEGEEYLVEITSNSTVTNFNFSQQQMKIGFNVTGDEGTVGFCNVTIPNILLGGPYTVLVNDVPITSEWTWNNTHSFIYFTYTHSEHHIDIVGSSAIPEFPLETFLLLLAMLSSVAAVMVKKRR